MLAILAFLAIFVMATGLLKEPYMTIEGVDPTSLTSLVIVIEGLFLAFVTAVAVQDWNWYDMVRGQITTKSYIRAKELGYSKNPIRLITETINATEIMPSKVSPNGSCYSRNKCEGEIKLPTPILSGYLAMFHVIVFAYGDENEINYGAVFKNHMNGMPIHYRKCISMGYEFMHITEEELHVDKPVLQSLLDVKVGSLTSNYLGINADRKMVKNRVYEHLKNSNQLKNPLITMEEHTKSYV
jgi:hypothetical protein